MLTVVVILKALMEIAGLALVGQGVLYVFAGARREHNVFYGVLRTMTSPVVRLTRFITPRFIPDQQMGFVTFFLVAGLWLALVLLKAKLMYDAGLLTP